jgi:hypothetical protein
MAACVCGCAALLVTGLTNIALAMLKILSAGKEQTIDAVIVTQIIIVTPITITIIIIATIIIATTVIATTIIATIIMIIIIIPIINIILAHRSFRLCKVLLVLSHPFLHTII